MLSIVFHPTVENPPAGRLCVGTKNQSWDIELIGSGREAVLIVSRISMEFVECIVGNEYEQKLSFKNIGDVNYPVEFRTEPELPDITFDPPAVVLKPFGEGHVTVKFKPRQELQGTYDLVVSSPYSVHLIPVTLHSGIVAIDFSAASLDFGMFEKVRGEGAVRCSGFIFLTLSLQLRTVYEAHYDSHDSKYRVGKDQLPCAHPGQTCTLPSDKLQRHSCAPKSDRSESDM